MLGAPGRARRVDAEADSLALAESAIGRAASRRPGYLRAMIFDLPLFISGISIVAVGVSIGMALAFQWDSAEAVIRF
ncbi:hypothetical protein [Sandaracinus amylolyticus]|uniref:hypothetical protein n=1 Tax=Sandaracinus amylolyticus TaxID=927083 RepID=UPI001F2B60D6|nr:hypothetical protein [Sandaracinus amylolyticus]